MKKENNKRARSSSTWRGTSEDASRSPYLCFYERSAAKKKKKERKKNEEKQQQETRGRRGRSSIVWLVGVSTSV